MTDPISNLRADLLLVREALEASVERSAALVAEDIRKGGKSIVGNFNLQAICDAEAKLAIIDRLIERFDVRTE